MCARAWCMCGRTAQMQPMPSSWGPAFSEQPTLATSCPCCLAKSSCCQCYTVTSCASRAESEASAKAREHREAGVAQGNTLPGGAVQPGRGPAATSALGAVRALVALFALAGVELAAGKAGAQVQLVPRQLLQLVAHPAVQVVAVPLVHPLACTAPLEG